MGIPRAARRFTRADRRAQGRCVWVLRRRTDAVLTALKKTGAGADSSSGLDTGVAGLMCGLGAVFAGCKPSSDGKVQCKRVTLNGDSVTIPALVLYVWDKMRLTHPSPRFLLAQATTFDARHFTKQPPPSHPAHIQKESSVRHMCEMEERLAGVRGTSHLPHSIAGFGLTCLLHDINGHNTYAQNNRATETNSYSIDNFTNRTAASGSEIDACAH